MRDSKSSIVNERMLFMRNCLAIDVAKSKSMVTLVSSCGEVLIEPYEINHSINDLSLIHI